MSINGSIGWTLGGLFVILFVNGISAQDKNEQLLDSITIDYTPKLKRPFCNAFTGCGKKRSFYDNSVERQDVGEWITIRLPIFLYRTLIQVAGREIRDAIERTSVIENSPAADRVIGHDYISIPSMQKSPIRKRYNT